jgi:hypothetical protein
MPIQICHEDTDNDIVVVDSTTGKLWQAYAATNNTHIASGPPQCSCATSLASTWSQSSAQTVQLDSTQRQDGTFVQYASPKSTLRQLPFQLAQIVCQANTLQPLALSSCGDCPAVSICEVDPQVRDIALHYKHKTSLGQWLTQASVSSAVWLASAALELARCCVQPLRNCCSGHSLYRTCQCRRPTTRGWWTLECSSSRVALSALCSLPHSDSIYMQQVCVFMQQGCVCVCLLLQDLVQSCLRGEGGDIWGHVLRETTSRGLCGLVCSSRTSERGAEGDCVKEGGGGEGKCERERCVCLLLQYLIQSCARERYSGTFFLK